MPHFLLKFQITLLVKRYESVPLPGWDTLLLQCLDQSGVLMGINELGINDLGKNADISLQ